MKLTSNQTRDLILFIVGQVDYDAVKGLDPEIAEEPEYAKKQMKSLIKETKKYIKNQKLGD